MLYKSPPPLETEGMDEEKFAVIHRVGGLECIRTRRKNLSHVIHRVGGLESNGVLVFRDVLVIHRVGGLE